MWVPKSGEILLEEGGAGAGPWATGSGPQGQERDHRAEEVHADHCLG